MQGISTTNTVQKRPSLDRIPTLHKRSARELTRQKSGKKLKEEDEREKVLKALSKRVPPERSFTTPDWGKVERKDTKKHHGLKEKLKHAASTVSLQMPSHKSSESIADREEDGNGWDIKGWLAPRPTIRYSAQQGQYKREEAALARSESNRKRAADKLPENGDSRSKKRIDDLADDMDASEIRQMMERDNERRGRRKLSEQERTEKRLARRKARQKLEEAAALQQHKEPPKNLERGVMGREVTGLGLELGDPAGAERGSSEHVVQDVDEKNPLPEEVQNPFTDPSGAHVTDEKAPPEVPQDPFSDPDETPQVDDEGSDSRVATAPVSPMSELEEPIIGIAQVARLSRANMSPPPSPRHQRNTSAISQIQDLPPPIQAVEKPPPIPPRASTPAEPLRPEAQRGSSETGSSKQHTSWRSWFKRSRNTDRRSSTQSSFSNTTRDSFIEKAEGSEKAAAPVTYFSPLASSKSGIPKRTMSRFKEDLPERNGKKNDFPISPPDSRVQSPESELVPPPRNPSRLATRPSDTTPSAPIDIRRPSEQRSLQYETPIPERSPSHRQAPSPELTNILTQSLASVDSEGSWLSGKPSRRNSKRSSMQTPSSALRGRDDHSSLAEHREYSDESGDETGRIAEDEYFTRLTPAPGDDARRYHADKNRISGNPMPSSDEDSPGGQSPGVKNEKWGSVGVAHTPTVVRREPAHRTQSSQAILSTFDDSSDDGTVSSPVTPEKHKGAAIDSDAVETPGADDEAESPLVEEGDKMHRATSVNLGRAHVRHISVGSARLLDVKPRQSGEAKRASVA
jgi:hypothetical protein